MACVSKRLGRSIVAEGHLVARRGSAAALAFAVLVAIFPDERIYVATHWLHGSTDLNKVTGEVSSPDRPNWYALTRRSTLWPCAEKI
jgi:hypothetical protein